MEESRPQGSADSKQELTGSSYAHCQRVFGQPGAQAPAGMVFDTPNFAMMAMAYPPNSATPDLNTDGEGDRILVVLEGDLALQIGDTRYRFATGDSIRIPRGTRFGGTRSTNGAQLLIIRAKRVRSFSLRN